MKFYFTFSQIPELSALTRPQRKAAAQCAMEALFTEQPATMSIASRLVFGGILAGALIGWMIGSGTTSSLPRILIAAGCALIGLTAGNLVGSHILHTRLRPYLQRVLEERKDELAQIK